MGTPCLPRPDAVKKTTPGGVRSGQESAKLAHAETEQEPKIAAAVLRAFQGFEADSARSYYNLVFKSLNEDARHDLQARTSG
jgi:hypothetical protein